MTAPDTPKSFWESKILNWEDSRYSARNALNPLSWTVRRRLLQAERIVRERLPAGASVLELGCGSGLLAERLKDHCRNYIGIDIAESAIARAGERGLPETFRFMADDVSQLAPPWADLTIFLGLTDWLSPEQLQTLLSKIKSRDILFSYTEAYNWSPYRLYRNWVDGTRAANYRQARSYTRYDIEAVMSVNNLTMEVLVKAAPHNPGSIIWARRI
jgi:SAM-dependent methyltransferase